MSSDAPQSDDPASVNFWLEHYKGTCDTYAAENVRLKGEAAFLKRGHLEDIDRLKAVHDGLKREYDGLQQKYGELKDENDELKGENDAFKGEIALLRRPLGLASARQSRTPSRAATSEVRVSAFCSPMCRYDGS